MNSQKHDNNLSVINQRSKYLEVSRNCTLTLNKGTTG